MRYAKILSFVGFLIMLGMLIYGFTMGDFSGEGKILLGLPWGQISLVDIYIEFILVCAWIIHREKNIIKSLIWVILVLTLGSMVSCFYVFLALKKSNGDWGRFWNNKIIERGF
jgi:hypothetical protein